MKKTRTIFVTGLTILFLRTLSAGDGLGAPDEMSLADLLPPETIFYFERPEDQAQAPVYKQSVFHAVSQHPEMAAYMNAFTAARQTYVQEIATHAKLEPAFVESILKGRLSGALMNIEVAENKDGKQDLAHTVVIAARLSEKPDPEKLFQAIQAMMDRWRQHHAAQTKIPLQQVAWRENYPGGHTVMMIAAANPIRFVLLGRTLIFFRGPKSEGLKTLLANHDNPLTAKSLSRSPLYLAVQQGAEAKPGMSFLFVNTVRLYGLLGAVRMPKLTRLLDVLGMGGVQGLGLAGGYYGQGIRHTLYLHAPRERRGLLKALSMKHKAEEAAVVLPKNATGILAARANLATLYQEVPLLVDAVEQALEREAPLSLSTLARQQDILGVKAKDVITTLGDAVILEPGPAGWALRFDNAHVLAFESAIARMEKTLGKPFTSLPIKTATGQIVTLRYFNRADQLIPVAPSYVVTQKRENGMGVIYAASYPQALKAILRQKDPGSLQNASDYKRVSAGMGNGYGVFLYIRNGDGYARVYDNVLLPLLNIWRNKVANAPDPGLLPPGHEIGAPFFGCGVGIKNNPEGIAFTAYSPAGLGGFGVFLVDKLLVSNPTAIPMVAAKVVQFLQPDATPAEAVDPLEEPVIPDATDPKERIPGIGGK